MLFDIQRGCIDDGPGIRTTIFMKGCPLNCIWCHNPESKSPVQQQYLDKSKTVGYTSSVTEVMAIVMKDKAFYKASDGGMTISGGEPLMQPDFAYELLHCARENDIHTCMETSGYADESVLERLLPVTNLFLYDIKAPVSTHKELTGVDNKVIMSNLSYLYRSKANLILRCPIVPTQNDTEEHFSYLRLLMKEFPDIIKLQLLPYHNMGVEKGRRLGIKTTVCMDNPGKDQIERWYEKLKSNEK